MLPTPINKGLSQYGKGLNFLQKTLFDILKKQEVADAPNVPAAITNNFSGKIGLITYPFRN